MNDEIKEILKCMKNYGSTTELALLDYITNLQQKEELFEKIVYKYDELKQENERLKLEKDTKSASEIICENLHDVYKSRCEKAVEYIEEHIKYECDDTFNGMQFYSYHLYDFNKDDLLNILNRKE